MEERESDRGRERERERGSSTRNTRLKTVAALYVPRFASVIATFLPSFFFVDIFWPPFSTRNGHGKFVGHGLSQASEHFAALRCSRTCMH